jgi:putative Mg2+ transporter-C (MgtC) family protein
MDTNIAWAGDLPDVQQLVRVSIRLLIAMVAGAVIGAQREATGKAAGLRTHVLVALGSAIFVLAGFEYGFGNDPMSRIIQGLITGMGFIGGGAILKLAQDRQIKGLTTAGSIWATAAVGVAAGLGQLAVVLVATVLTWVVLAVFAKWEKKLKPAKAVHEETE